MASSEEVENLKNYWAKHPNWDLENTPGFEENIAELLNFKKLTLAEQKQHSPNL